MSEWDALRQKTKGRAGPMPRCRRCRRPRVLDPCRDCATDAELERQGAPEAPPPIIRPMVDLPAIVVEELPPRFAGQSPVSAMLDGLRATQGAT